VLFLTDQLFTCATINRWSNFDPTGWSIRPRQFQTGDAASWAHFAARQQAQLNNIGASRSERTVLCIKEALFYYPADVSIMGAADAGSQEERTGE
jgi:hypothetical protein